MVSHSVYDVSFVASITLLVAARRIVHSIALHFRVGDIRRRCQ